MIAGGAGLAAALITASVLSGLAACTLGAWNASAALRSRRT